MEKLNLKKYYKFYFIVRNCSQNRRFAYQKRKETKKLKTTGVEILL